MKGDLLFDPATLADHTRWYARGWHIARKALFVGWRTIKDEATFTGVVVDGETDPDGDTCFNIQVLPDLEIHCEVDPNDLASLRDDLLKLRIGMPATITGKFVLDLGHAFLELHPVTKIEVD